MLLHMEAVFANLVGCVDVVVVTMCNQQVAVFHKTWQTAPVTSRNRFYVLLYYVKKTKKKVWHQERQITHTEIFLGRIDTWIIKQCPRFTQWLYVRRGEAGGGCDLSGLQQRILLLRVLFHCRRFRCLSSGLLSLKRSRYHHKPLAFNQSSVTVTVASPEMDSNTHT